MKSIALLAALSYLFAGPISGQAPQQSTVLPAACGPTQVKFDTRKVKQHPLVTNPGKNALVYVISQLEFGGITTGCQVVTRIGVDGKWQGANCGSSYLSAIVPAGEHHVCADWQSTVFLSSRPQPALNSFTAEAGKIYYFRAKALYIKGVVSLDLDPINPDEGQSLVSSSSASSSEPKK
jgi:hypothetical protein